MGPPQQQLAKPWCPGARGAPRKVVGAAAEKAGEQNKRRMRRPKPCTRFCVTFALPPSSTCRAPGALGAAPRGRASIRVLGKTSGRGTQEAAAHNQVGGRKHFEGRRERPGGRPGLWHAQGGGEKRRPLGATPAVWNHPQGQGCSELHFGGAAPASRKSKSRERHSGFVSW